MFEILNLKLETKIKNYLESRFGINKKCLDKYDFLKKGKKIFIISKQKKEYLKKIILLKNIENIGIELFVNYKDYTISSLSFTLFEYTLIKYNYIILNREQTKKYFNLEKIYLKNIKEKKILSFGNIVAIYNNKIIGILNYNNKDYTTSNIVIKNSKIK